MFIGHYAVALAAKKVAPETSLGTLFLAAQFPDLLCPVLLLLGLEHVRIDPSNTAFTPYDFYDYPISHSLLAVIGWSLTFGLIYFAVRRNRKGALLLGIGVLSHWILDAVAHRPDMPIAPGIGIYVGLGLWNSVPATVLTESALFIAGVILYVRSMAALDRTGRYVFWVFIAFSGLIYAGSIFNQQPLDEKAMAIAGLSQWFIIPWTYWIDRHRRSVVA